MDKLTQYVIVEKLRNIIALACIVCLIVFIHLLISDYWSADKPLFICCGLFIFNLILKEISKHLKKTLKQ